MPVNKVIVTLTSIPQRLVNSYGELGFPSCINSLCNQNYEGEYEIHLNLPKVYKLHNADYVIPDWLLELESKDPKLTIFRVDDIGP